MNPVVVGAVLAPVLVLAGVLVWPASSQPLQCVPSGTFSEGAQRVRVHSSQLCPSGR